MGRYTPFNTYEDPDDPPLWAKALFLLVLCGAVALLVRCCG